MSHHEGAADPESVVRQFTDALHNRDLAAAQDLLSEDIEWHEIGMSEGVRGKEALRQRFSQPDAQSWDITGETHDIIAGPDHVVALQNAVATKDGQSLAYRVAEVYHVANGKITGRWAMSDDTEAINRFFGG